MLLFTFILLSATETVRGPQLHILFHAPESQDVELGPATAALPAERGEQQFASASNRKAPTSPDKFYKMEVTMEGMEIIMARMMKGLAKSGEVQQIGSSLMAVNKVGTVATTVDKHSQQIDEIKDQLERLQIAHGGKWLVATTRACTLLGAVWHIHDAEYQQDAGLGLAGHLDGAPPERSRAASSMAPTLLYKSDKLNLSPTSDPSNINGKVLRAAIEASPQRKDHLRVWYDNKDIAIGLNKDAIFCCD